ncbi:MAG: arylsulfatase, partial [Muribaculaceae bacterium]|nr:arylsulfatase [Muribaculaceae bacterium]
DFRKRYANKAKSEDYFDGISFLPELLGRGQAAHEFLYWEFEETDQIAVRYGDWKLIVKKGRPELYDLSTDIHEDRDVAARHPDIVAAMVDIIHREHTPSELFKVTLTQR